MVSALPVAKSNSDDDLLGNNRQNDNIDGSNLFISTGATELFNLEKEMLTATINLNSENQEKVDEINAQIDKLIGTSEVKLSSIDKKDADKIYKQIDSIFSDGIVTKDEEKELVKLDSQIGDIEKKYQTPLTKDQQQKLDNLFAQLDKLYTGEDTSKIQIGKDNINEIKHLLDNSVKNESEEEEQSIDLIKTDVAELISLNGHGASPESNKSIFDKFPNDDKEVIFELFEKIGNLFADGKINKDEELKLAKLDEQIKKIYTNR
jgi:hypothetical protein